MSINLLSDLTATKIRSISSIYTKSGKLTERKNRPAWAVLYKYEGETVYENLGRTYISNAQSALILPKGSSYVWQCHQSGHYYVIEFEAEAECEQIFSFPAVEREKLLRLFREAEHAHNLRGPTFRLEAMKNLYSILVLLLGARQKGYVDSDQRRKIAPALEFISKNYDKSIRNEALAELCSLSTVYFRKLFTKVTGLSPITYIHTLRMAKAKKMLESDYDHLGEIAISLGYPDIYTFSKVFKKYVGLPPSRYEKERARKKKEQQMGDVRSELP